MNKSRLVDCVRFLAVGMALLAGAAAQAAPTKTISPVVLHDGSDGLALSAPDAAVDADGNIHIVAQGRTTLTDSNSVEIYYMLVEPDGTVLIDATKVNTADAIKEGRPSIAVRSDGKAVVLIVGGPCCTPGPMTYALIDPSVDDQDGDAGVGIVERAEATIGVDNQRVGITDLVLDSLGNAHAFKASSTSVFHVSFNPATGVVVRAEHAIGSTSWVRGVRAAVDSDDNLHVVYLGSGAAETNNTPLYTMLDIDGDTLIPPVQLSPDYEEHGAHVSIMVDGSDRPMIVFGDKRNTLDAGQPWCGWDCQTAGTMFFVRLDPSRHPQDGTTEATIDELRISNELSLGALWYGQAFRAPSGAVHFFSAGVNGSGGIHYRKITPGSPSKASTLKVFDARFDTFNFSKAYPAGAADKLIWSEAIYMPTPDATSLQLVMADMDSFASAKGVTSAAGGGSAGGAWMLGGLLPLLAAAFARRRRATGAFLAIFAGLFYAGSASAAKVVLHDGEGSLALSAARAAAAPDGNIHIVAQGRPTADLTNSSSTEIYYMYVSSKGTVRIDATLINTADTNSEGRPTILALDNGKAVILWNNGATSQLSYALIDPSVDDQDGDAGVGIVEDGPTVIGTDTGTGYVEGVLDSTGMVHVIKDTGTLFHLSFNPATGVIDTAEHTVASTGRRHPPALAIDGDDNLHLAYGSDTVDTLAPAVYLMLDSAGAVLIDETQLFEGDIFPHARHLSLAADSNGYVHIVYGDKRNTLDANSWCDFCQTAGSSFYVRLDPSLHAQDGSAGDVAALRIGNETALGDLWYGRAFLYNGKMRFFAAGHQGRGSMVYETISPTSSGASVSSARFYDTQLGGFNFSKNYPTFTAGKVIWAEDFFAAPLTQGSVRLVMDNLSAFQPKSGGGGGAPAPLMLALLGLAALCGRLRMRRGG